VASEYAAGKVLHEHYHWAEFDLGKQMQATIRQAHADLVSYAEQNPDLRFMGTTVMAPIVHGERLIIGNVGDGRAYLIRNGGIRQITSWWPFRARW
jgi:protein phosphatase